ncbi:MAG: 2-phospho-L-lactate guanylyltransferase [Pseudomonadota bacterium]
MRRHLSPTLIVVAMKDPGAAKTRLCARLGPAERRRLALTLFDRTLCVLGAVRRRLDVEIAVVTPSPDIAGRAMRAGAHVIGEDQAAGLNAAAARAARWAEAAGHTRLCLLPADIAAPDPRDIAQLIATAEETAAPVLCPAHDGGTNALVLPLPAGLAFRYGPGSAKRHAAVARAAGFDPILLPLQSLREDVDTPDTYARALEHRPDLRRAVAG